MSRIPACHPSSATELRLSEKWGAITLDPLILTGIYLLAGVNVQNSYQGLLFFQQKTSSSHGVENFSPKRHRTIVCKTVFFSSGVRDGGRALDVDHTGQLLDPVE